MTAILGKLDELIRRITHVQVCEEQWKLLGNSLTRLRRDELINEDIEQVLEILTILLASCNENENDLDGMTYKDLQSIFYRLQWYLLQYEINNTVDQEMKLRKLTDGYIEMHQLIEKTPAQTVTRRLDEIEKYTKENTIEQYRLLREKHGESIENHLRNCVEMNRSIPLDHFIPSALNRVTQTFYQTSPQDSIQFVLPLTKPLTQFESDQSRRFLKPTWQKVLSTPDMLSAAKNNRSMPEEDITAENILRKKRWIVILGEAGCGKSCFSRWIVHHHAEKSLQNEFDSTSFGLIRIPILIEMKDFVHELQSRSTLTLFDYIKKDFLQDCIEQGQALIILDGFDEIYDSIQRVKAMEIIETFVQTYVQIPTNTAVDVGNRYLHKLLDDPSKFGGNQLIITSRISGYQPARFSHYTIQPMDTDDTKKMIKYWFTQVHQQILDHCKLTVANQGETHANQLINELEKSENISLVNLTTNPALTSFICQMCFNQLDDTPLPSPRIRQFDQIIDSIFKQWSRQFPINSKGKIIRILTDIAFNIQQYNPSNYLDEEELIDICFRSVKTFESKLLLTSDDLTKLENDAVQFSRIILEDLSLFTIRDDKQYAFRYRAFQDYFTALHFIESKKSIARNSKNNIQLLVQSLRHHFNDLRFRNSILLLFGRISANWSWNDFDEFSRYFLEDKESIIPLGSYIFIIASEELVNYPSNEIFFIALDRLMISAGQHSWSIVSPFLFERLTKILRKLRNDIVSLWIDHFLNHHIDHDIRTLEAFCCFIEGKSHEFENIEWLDQSSCSILQSLSTHNHRFVIDRLLIKVAFAHHQLLPINRTTFKGFLLDGDISIQNIPMNLLPLIIMLYGGLKREGKNVLFDPSYIHRESTIMTPILINFLSVNDLTKQGQAWRRLRQECIHPFLARIENHDESPETVDLCIAILCLFDIEYIQENINIISKSLLRLIRERLKYISMILRQLYFPSETDDRSIENEVTGLIGIVIDKFQYVESARVQFLDLLDVLKRGIAHLRSSKTSILIPGEIKPDQRITLYLPNSLRKERFLHGLLSTDIQFPPRRHSCSLLYHFTKLFWISENDDQFETQYRTAVAMDSIPEYLTLGSAEDLLSSFVSIPSHLQSLYLRLLQQHLIVINPNEVKDEKNCLYFGHILVECLMHLSNPSCKRLMILTALINLLPWLRLQNLDTFGSSLLWAWATKDLEYMATYESKRHLPINEETDDGEEDDQSTDKNEKIFGGGDLSDDERVTLVKAYIDGEHERIQIAFTENNGRNSKLYSASISLARICRWSEDERRLSLLNESVRAAMLITNKLAQLDALCVIALNSHSDHDRIQLDTNRYLQEEIEYQFNEIYTTLPLLLHTAILIRCLPHLRDPRAVDRSLRNLYDKFADNDRRDQHAVSEALSPYLQSNCSFSLPPANATCHLFDTSKTIRYRSSVLKKYFSILTDQPLTLSVLTSNLYLMELTNDVHVCLKNNTDRFTIEELNSSMLTEAQAMRITKVLSYVPLVEQEQDTVNLDDLSDALHRINIVEIRARHILEGWLKWKDSDELSIFAYHAALILGNSDFWSVEAATIVCDLLRHENDRFCRRAEILFRSADDNDVRTSSKLGIDVLLVLMKKRTHYQVSSSSAKLTVNRIMLNITVDIQSHLEIFLWLERYRIHALANPGYPLQIVRSGAQCYVSSYFSPDLAKDACCCMNLFKLSADSIAYMCDMIGCQFFSFLEIDGDSTSDAVLQSHTQFIISIITSLDNVLNSNDDFRQTAFDSLVTLFDMSENDGIRQAVACALGYVCTRRTYKSLFDRIQTVSNNGFMGISEYSDYALAGLISSYCYCLIIHKIALDQDDMDLFSNLLENGSEVVINAVRTGYGRVLRDTPLLLGILDCNHTLCYRSLVGATAYLFLYDVQQSSEIAAADFIEQNPIYLYRLINDLYEDIRHFDDRIVPYGGVEFYLNYGSPQYVKIASLVAQRIPTAFCAFINNWPDGEKLKRALFYTSKQHNFPQRAACLTILSVFGELTVDLCEMLVEAVHDDPLIQLTSYKCLMQINTISNEKAVIDRLQKYLQSKSMNVRYIAAKILLHLSKSSLIPFTQVQTMLNTTMLDPQSTETLLLIVSQDGSYPTSSYYRAGPLKDVIYFLLAQYLTNETSENILRKELNDIDSDFIESEKAARLSSCLYEGKTEETTANPIPDHAKSDDRPPTPPLLSFSDDEDIFD